MQKKSTAPRRLRAPGKRPVKARLKNLDKQPPEKPLQPKKSPPAEDLQKQYKALENKHQFLMAEYANYKKNNMKLIENIRKYEGRELIRKITSQVMDDFEKALNQEPRDISNFKKGILMIYGNLQQILSEAGVKSKGEQGDLFDPAVHSALDSVPHEKIPAEHIIHIVRKAYFLHDKLLRPAEVIVSRGPEERDAEK